MTSATAYRCSSCQGPLTVPDLGVIEAEVRAEEAPDEATRERRVAEVRVAALRFPPTQCDACYGLQDAARERSVKGREAEDRVRASGLPSALRDCSWGDMWPTSEQRKLAIFMAEKWAKLDNPRGLYLWGTAGTGKTRLAATAMLHRVTSGRAVRWVSVAHLLARLDASFSDRDRQDALKVLAGTGALVLDDLDKTSASEAKRAQLFVAIDRRISVGEPMLFTSNLPPKMLEDKFGEAIASRVLGYSLGRTVEMDGADLRLQLDV